ncbi:MAG: hypothetical protein BWY21_02195 [Parcubacteria group bacterium ADurb.Bin216]|nr:MAG: hypothetical protein BWY21_02195 [Parcubacteria group bacterium ADurb.Bin216]
MKFWTSPIPAERKELQSSLLNIPCLVSLTKQVPSDNTAPTAKSFESEIKKYGLVVMGS